MGIVILSPRERGSLGWEAHGKISRITEYVVATRQNRPSFSPPPAEEPDRFSSDLSPGGFSRADVSMSNTQEGITLPTRHYEAARGKRAGETFRSRWSTSRRGEKINSEAFSGPFQVLETGGERRGEGGRA